MVVVVVGAVVLAATVVDVVGGGGVFSGPTTGAEHPVRNSIRTAREPRRMTSTVTG